MAAESLPHRFSAEDDRSRVFESRDAPQRALGEMDGDWVDLYELLEVAPDTLTRDLDEIIIERGADVVYFTFSRVGRPARVEKLEKYLHDMRPILLDSTARRRYDEQHRLHKKHDPQAMTYQEFKQTLDIREQTGGCMTSLIFLVGVPLTLCVIDKLMC